MKPIYSLIVISVLVLTSCSKKKEVSVEDVIASQNLEQIRAKKTALDKQQLEISDKIKLLNVEIDKLNTAKKIPLVTTIFAKKQEFIHYLELQGNVQTKQNVLIYPEIAGTLENVLVKEGQRVTKGQILAKIDDGGLSQQVAQLEATTALAKTTFERQKRLWDQKIGSEIQFLQAKTQFEAQKNTLAQLKKQLAKATVRAPFSGIIDDVITDQGTVVVPGQSQLMRIINLSNMYIETDVPETYIKDVVVGKNVEVEFPILGIKINTKVRQTGNYINPANRTFKVEISVPNQDKNIKPNLTAKLKINDYTNLSALLIPQSIISENAEGEQYLYVVTNKDDKDGGVAKKVIIETGKTQGDFIEVLSGVKSGTEIIKEGARSVKNGQDVKVINY